MPAIPQPHPLIHKLENGVGLTDEECAALEALPMQVHAFTADQDMVREGDPANRSCLILEGYACSYKMTGDGRRQIMAFHVPGDVPDLQSLYLGVLDTSLGTLTACNAGFIPHDALRDLFRRHQELAEKLWRGTLVDASVFREWMTGLGRRDAYNRMAHFLCEWVVRLQTAGLAKNYVCELPMTQNELSDAQGLSTVHVNRVLQELRGDGLISLKGGTLTVLDWERLRKAGDFDPAYLHLVRTRETLP